ncbi:2-aminoadipate transaminase (plasmid) [Sulfitobacter dubius]|uniref:2-aminoadipate transaminase n=1 Tax=Sulfitobacter dubius TaxID=218673 RepID=A0ABY3ZQS5_9RHOB|nr:2-aminoadipate transaminase [Sulfitobacter dubius]
MVNKIDTIVQILTDRIANDDLKAGERLPSIRAAAQDHSVSKNTIVEAYDRLVARGLIAARQGAGFTVASQHQTLREDEAPRHLIEAVDSISLLRAQLDQNYAVRVGDGRPPASWMAGIPMRQLPDQDSDTSGYGSHMGYQPLRSLIAAHHYADGIALDANQIVTTFGANHGLDLIVRRYLKAGDTVLVDDPGYYPLFAKLRLAQVSYIGVPRGADGPDLEQLRNLAAQHRPKLFFTQSLAQNPTGTSMSLMTAHGVLKLAESSGFMVVDDDPFIDLPDPKGVRLAALDGFDRVIFVGTFSKTLSASFRTGYIAAPRSIAEELAELKMITTVNSSRMSEMIIAEAIRSRRYARHLNRLAGRLQDASEKLKSDLADLNLRCKFDPGQGYYAWLELPEGVSDTELARKAATEDIFLAPSTFFSAQENSGNAGIRLNITRTSDPRFLRFLAKQIGQ